MTSPSLFRSLTRSVPAVLAVAVVAVWSAAAPAGAHDGTATITVDQAHPSPGSIHYIIEVVWTDDGHPAVGATVTATPTSPSGEAGTPVEMAPSSEDEDGLYQGAVDLPEEGDWTVTFSSLEPDGTLEHTETVAAEASAEPDESAGAEDDTDDGAENEEAAPAEEEPEPEVSQSNPDANLSVEAGEESGDDGDDGPSVALLLLAFAVLGAVVAGAFWFMMKRKEAEDGTDAEATAGSEDTTTEASDASGEADADSQGSE